MEKIKETMKEGALPAKTKELVAIAVSIAAHCEPCLKVHIEKATKHGASKEEIMEILAIATMICGAPETVWARKIMLAFFKKE